MLPLVPYFRDFNRDEAQALAEEAVRNNQIWSAAKCRTEYLPEFIRVQGKNIKPKTRKALHYQIQNDEWYIEKS